MREFQDTRDHLRAARQGSHAGYRPCDCKFAHRAAAPHDAHTCHVVRPTVDDHLLDQTAQQRFAPGVAGARIGPQSRQVPGKRDHLALQVLIKDHRRG